MNRCAAHLWLINLSREEFPNPVTWTSSFPFSWLYGGIFHFTIKFSWDFLLVNSGDPDKMPHFVASHLGPHCFQISHIKDDRLIQFDKI